MKNLINYLSKKRLSLENGSRMVRDRFEIGSAKSRKSLGSNLSRFSLASLICLCMLTVGVGNVWGATITFNVKGQGSGNSYITTETQYTSGSTTYKLNNWIPNSGQVRGNKSTASQDFYIYNTSAIPGTISGISITGGSYTYSKIYYNTNTSSITSHTTTNSMSSASATISNGTGTYFRMNFVNGATSGTQCMTSVTITFCPNPTSLTNGDITANTAQLSWSDSYNTNSYEVYVSTSSTTPAYNATPSATGGSGKSAEVTGLNASTTYNWWVRSKISDTSKSQWVKGTNFTTSAGSCTAPSSVSISGTTKYLGGQTISLTATPDGGTGTPSYQWQKKISGTWTDLSNGTVSGVTTSGATSNNLQISSCTHENSGGYRCIVSTGATCSTKSHADGTDGYGVHVFSVYGGYVGESWSDEEIAFSAGTSGTATVHLNAGSLYKFHIRSNNGAYYCNGTADYNGDGNGDDGTTDGWYVLKTTSSIGFGRSDKNYRIYTGPEGDYTITVNIANALTGDDYVTVDITYPTPDSHPCAGYAYFEKPSDWTNVYLYWYTNDNSRLSGWSATPEITTTATICGTTYYYTPLGSSFSNVIFKGNGSNQWTSLATSGFSKKYLDKTVYASPAWATFATYTITFAKGDGDGTMSAISSICPSADQDLTANGYTAPSHYHFNGWKTNAALTYVAYGDADDGTHEVTVAVNGIVPDKAKIKGVSGNITLTAQWAADVYTVSSTLSNCSSSPTIPTSYTYTGSAAGLTYTISANSGYRLPTSVTVSGSTYTWNSNTGALALTGTITGNVSITVTAVQTHTIDWYVGGSAPGNKIGDDGQTTVVDHGGKISAFPATTPDGSACDKTFVGWTNTSSYVHGTSPLFNDVAGSPTINADASFYAVFAEVNSVSASLTKMTADDDLEVGDKIVIIAQDTRYGMYQASASSYVSYWTTTDMDGEPSLSEIEADDKKYLDVAAGSASNTWKLGDATNGYLYNASSTNLEFSTTNSSDLTLITWTDDSFTFVAGQEVSCRTDITGANANKWRGAGASCDPETGDNCSGTPYYYLYKYVPGGTTATGHTIVCGSCSNEVTVAYTAAPTEGTVAVTKGGAAVAAGSTVKTCTGGASLVVTVTPSTHYSVSGVTFTPSAGLVAGDLSGTSTPASTTAGVWTYNVTIAEDAAGTLTIAPTLVEEAHIAITWNVNGVALSPSPAEGLTWVYSGGDLTALPSEPSVPAGCSGTKVFAGWSEKHSDAKEEDASYYDDLFTAVGGAPTGISSAKTFYAVFATSSANPLAGTVIWDEPFTGFAADAVPTAKSSGATVYNSTVLTYACEDGGGTTKIYTADLAGGSSPELLVAKSGGSLTVSNIPTAGQTELTLSYKANYALEISSGTSGVTIGDASVEGSTYTRTITISQSPSAVNNFSLAFTKSTTGNARLDDIHLVVPGSGTMTDYVTLCAPSWTITYNKNTEDAVTNLPSPTSVLQSTGSGTLSSTVPERATYTFSGWAETTSGAVAYAAGGSITGVTGDKTLYAVWVKTPVEELLLNYSELNKYVGDPAVTLEVTGVTPEGADATVTWSSNNSTVASVVAATGVVTFSTVGTATITATSTVTGTTTAYCYVTVRNKPTASFTDLIHDGNGTDLSTYHMQNVAGTAIVFPTLDDYATPGDDCDTKHYVFVGWTTSDNNDDPQDHLVASGELEDDQDKVFYAVWADGVEGVSYTQLTTSTFKTSPTKYVIGAIDGDDTFYFYSCAVTDANNGNGGCTNAPGTNAPIQFTLSGTANALVATSTEASARYLTPLTAKNFQMSETSKTIQLNDDGTIANPSDDSWTLRFNTSEDYLRWYSSATGNAAYFYEVTAGAAVSYRTSCCTNNVPAPTVVATNTAYTVTLTWAAVDGATGYEVSWNGGAFTAATSPCVKSDLTASTDYTYKVRATYAPLVKCGALVASGSVTTDDVYSVTYSGGTGTGSCSPSGSVATVSYEAGATVTLAPTNSYSMTSNTFAAWVVKDADDNDVPVSNNQFTMPAKNVTVTATWTAVQDKYYDRMHDGTDALHGGFADGEGKYYLVLEGCNYTVPTLTDDDDGDTDCHTTHYKLLGWIAYSHLKTDGSGEIKPGEESYIFQGGGTKSATGATYYAIWAIMTE